ncbi:MAG: DNA polymerase III subunit gamma and tau [Microbacteriaceae bacterium]|nr:DNA polymerase III subunit gamma and tau [Microbacteriaceae bacterium]
MVTALYRRYRPENFAELIGQAQVTAPLMTALRADRVNHAYLFSGPRGCGKTTSARILARCLNCAEGPTDTPCGKCPSCIELSRDGGGSLDVVEIDAASHNGVDDARDLRERAAFAPARDRYKIFILDEAHMVTAAGFNALLKIVEEPPAHVKFIFATTEPEKVISTIRSRTHHYPFRLVPPAQMLDYLEQMCVQEGVEVAPGVLPLVVRSGGGSVRDSLSLLDQLIAGSEGAKVEYERAVALLGYTPDNLLDEAVNALSIKEPSAAFSAVDRVIQSGQDPRQFVEDILERLRDLMLVSSVGNDAKAVLRGVSDEQLENMRVQASRFGAAELSHAADVVNDALTQMSGATSPKLHLELMIGRVLVPAADQTEVGSLARIERLERRIGIAGTDAPATAAVTVVSAPAPAAAAKVEPAKAAPAAADSSPAPAKASTAPAPAAEALVPAAKTPTAVPVLTTAQFRDSWNAILSLVEKRSKSAWVIAYTLTVVDFTEDVLTLRFASQNDLESFKSAGQAPDILREAIRTELGVTVKFKPHVDAPAAPASAAAAAPVETAPAAPTTPIALVEEPKAAPAEAEEAKVTEPEPAPPAEPKASAKSRKADIPDDERYGESILREFGATPLDNPSGGR